MKPSNKKKAPKRGTKSALKRKRAGKKAVPKQWELKLYVAGKTPKSIEAFNNLKAICEEHLKGLYHITIIDLLEKPKLARGDQIVAIPTLVRNLPEPIRKIIGDLSNTERVLVGLNISPAGKS